MISDYLTKILFISVYFLFSQYTLALNLPILCAKKIFLRRFTFFSWKTYLFINITSWIYRNSATNKCSTTKYRPTYSTHKWNTRLPLLDSYCFHTIYFLSLQNNQLIAYVKHNSPGELLARLSLLSPSLPWIRRK